MEKNNLEVLFSIYDSKIFPPKINFLKTSLGQIPYPNQVKSQRIMPHEFSTTIHN